MMASMKMINMIYVVILANILFMAIVSGCLSSTTPSENTKYVDVSAQQGKEMIDNGEVFLLVHSDIQYEGRHNRVEKCRIRCSKIVNYVNCGA